MDQKVKTWTLRFSAKENLNMEKALFNWPIELQCDFKAKYRLISRKFWAWGFFTRAFAEPTKSHARLYPFDKPIKSLYFPSLVVSVLFARLTVPCERSISSKFSTGQKFVWCNVNVALISKTFFWSRAFYSLVHFLYSSVQHSNNKCCNVKPQRLWWP